jgi:hypothetical protein
MRWLLIVLLVSLAALLFAVAGVAHHIWKQRNRHGGGSSAAVEPAEDHDLEAKR